MIRKTAAAMLAAMQNKIHPSAQADSFLRLIGWDEFGAGSPHF